MRRVVCGVLVVLALSGCGRESTGQAKLPPQYESGGQIRDALARSGLGCDGFQAIDAHHRDFGEQDAVETDTCRIDNEDVSISIWRSLGQKQDWAGTRAGLGCQFAESLGDNVPVYVDGGRWTITVPSRTLADRVAGALGGDVRSPDCRSIN
jgi:hypothetical protein